MKVIEVYKVAPATATVSDDYVHLTFFDSIWLRYQPTQRVFFYEIKDLSFSVFSEAILPKLKHALSLALQYYPPLAGNLTWHPVTGKPVIRLSPEDGVLLTVAESSADFHSLSTDDVKEAKELHDLLSECHVSKNQATVMSLQVTLFPGYGFSVGYNVHHAVVDGKSATMFFKSWAKICQVGELTPEMTPVLERSVIEDPLNVCTIFTDVWKRMQPEGKLSLMEMKPEKGLLRRTFRLTRRDIDQVKSKINRPVSIFTAVCSYIWTCLIKSEGEIPYENVILGINVDCRARLKPPIPTNYFGNCVAFGVATANVASLEGGEGLETAAAAIRDAIGSLPEGVVKGAENWLTDDSLKIFDEQKVYSIGGSPRFELYAADFGWGRPTKVEMVSIDKSGAFSLCDDRDDNGGMEVGIVLTMSKMEAFGLIFNEGLQDIL